MTALNLGGLPGCGASMKSGQKWCEWSKRSSQMGLARHQTVSMDPYKTDPDEFCQDWSLGWMGGTVTTLKLGW